MGPSHYNIWDFSKSSHIFVRGVYLVHLQSCYKKMKEKKINLCSLTTESFLTIWLSSYKGVSYENNVNSVEKYRNYACADVKQ